MYSWTNVAERTERVYDGITGAISEEEFYGDVSGGGWSATRGRAGVQSFALIDRLKRYYGCGIWAGKLFCLCVIIDYLLFQLLEMLAPRANIDVCKNWPTKRGTSSKLTEEELDEATPLKITRSRASSRGKGRIR